MDVSSEARVSDSEVEHKVLHTTHKLTPPGTWQPWTPNPSLQSGLDLFMEQYKEICQRSIVSWRISYYHMNTQEFTGLFAEWSHLSFSWEVPRTTFWFWVPFFSKHSLGEIWKRPLCKSTGACQDQIAGLLPPSASRCLSAPDSLQTTARGDAPETCGCSVEGRPRGLHVHNTAINHKF